MNLLTLHRPDGSTILVEPGSEGEKRARANGCTDATPDPDKKADEAGEPKKGKKAMPDPDKKA